MKRFIFLGLVCSIIYLPACKKTDIKQQVSGTKGYVSLIDRNNKMVSDISGTIVSVENSSPVITLPVSANGEFELPMLSNYAPLVLVFSHVGYGTVKQYYTPSCLDSIKKGLTNVQNTIFLFPKSSVIVNSLSGTLSGDIFKMVCNVSVSDANSINGVTFFIQKNNSEVSFNNCYGNNSTSRFLTIPVSNGDNISTMCMRCLKDCGFAQAGDKLYVNAYGDDSSPFQSFYVDGLTSKLVFPCLNPNSNSSTISFIVP